MSPRGRRAEIDDTLTMAPRPAVFRMAGMAWREARNIVSTFTCITRRQVSGSSSTTVARLPMPTLLSRKSSRPKRSTAAATMSRHPVSSVTSASCAAAVPPSAAIIATVRSASASARSTTRTLVPARASSMAAARPLPMPSSAAPPPVTMATRPSSPRSSSGRVVIVSISSSLEARWPHARRHRVGGVRGHVWAPQTKVRRADCLARYVARRSRAPTKQMGPYHRSSAVSSPRGRSGPGGCGGPCCRS